MRKTGIIFASVILSLILLSGITIPSYSDYLSPKKQLESGVLPEDVVCKVNRILVIRDNGSPACVTEKTAEKKGWRIVAESTEHPTASVSEHSELQDTASVPDSVKIGGESVDVAQTYTDDDDDVVKETILDNSSTLTPNDVDSIEYDAALMSILETDLVFANKQLYPNVVYPAGTHEALKWPTYEVIFPRMAQVGVPFDVVYDYAYVIPDEETGSYVNFNEQCENCASDYFSARVSSFVDVESDNLEYFSETFDQEMIPMRNYAHYYYVPEFDNTKPLQEIFTFVINEPGEVYRIGEINISINQDNKDLVYFYVDGNGTILFDPFIEKETFAQSSFATSSAPSVMNTASIIKTEIEKLQERPHDQLGRTEVHVVYDPDNPPDFPEFMWAHYAGWLLEYYPDTDYREWLLENYFTEDWVNRFLTAHPELENLSTPIEYDAALMSILETDLVFANKQINPNVWGYNIKKWPTYEVTFPRMAQVGVPFDVVYDYAYVIPDEETGSYVNFNEQCENCERDYFSASVSSFVDVESDNLKYFSETFDQKMIPMRNYTHYSYTPEFDNTKPLQEIFTFVINEPDVVYRIGEINISINQDNDDLVYFYVDENGTILLDPLIEKETFAQSSFATSSVPSVMNAASVIKTEIEKLQERPYDQWGRTEIHVVYGPDNPPDFPEVMWAHYAKNLLESYPDTDYREWLLEGHFTEDWINRFLTAHPELENSASTKQ